jgi:hypothetical protein
MSFGILGSISGSGSGSFFLLILLILGPSTSVSAVSRKPDKKYY